ncbi:putative ankyrin repeat protein RF_0381 [Cotesia glomerata]|uniref:putative ankyrin repeat protein RF_0381 n=1 Tax=Cotesia glomerata TaxID=32391 RepID=UPI001D027A9C|nr:putative ankyrin repeat protein RF_0381 [Cotesia glomerata]
MASKKPSECSNLGYHVIWDIRSGKIDEARAVIEKHGLQYFELWSQDTPLHLAVLNKYKGIVKTLLDRGADINALNSEGMTPLDLAANSQLCSIVELILCQKNEVISSKWANYPLLHSAATSSVIIVQNLLDKGLEVDFLKDGLTPLHRATFSGCLAVVKCLVEHQANINAVSNSNYHLGFAARYVAQLSAKQAMSYLDRKNTSPISSAYQDKETPLSLALLLSNEKIINVFLSHGVDINTVMHNGLTPLQYAVKNDKESMVLFLLKHGADIKILDKSGRSILHFTLPLSKSAVLLLKAGANVNAKNRKGEALLHCACENGNLRGVKTLLKYGADINLRSFRNMLPIENLLTLTVLDTIEKLEIVKLIHQRAIFLQMADLYLDKFYSRSTTTNFNWSGRHLDNFIVSTEKKACEEINDLKKKYIACNLTFYSLLMKSSHELAIYKRNPAINKIIQSIDILEVFPIYGSIILRNLVAASAPMKMIEEAKKRDIYRVFPQISIEIIEHIFKFLNNDDFFNLIRALI